MLDSLGPTIIALQSSTCRSLRTGTYVNNVGVHGSYYMLQARGQTHMLSVSNTGGFAPTIREIAEDLKRVQVVEGSKLGFYVNKRHQLGFYATVHSYVSYDGQPHAYMIARTHEIDNIKRFSRDQRLTLVFREICSYILAHEKQILLEGSRHRAARRARDNDELAVFREGAAAFRPRIERF